MEVIGYQALIKLRQNAIRELKKYKGKLIEIPYTKGIDLLFYQWSK